MNEEIKPVEGGAKAKSPVEVKPKALQAAGASSPGAVSETPVAPEPSDTMLVEHQHPWGEYVLHRDQVRFGPKGTMEARRRVPASLGESLLGLEFTTHDGSNGSSKTLQRFRQVA